ncbi:MAG: hypothetical protein KKE62_02640 [Proteobacteria bacterium]|nr:hypothetical protein [Pseudomonadota bacterium]MBU1387436.1 hypothetical protein [Pseudomonadota bacterium]MBU1541721.1 hypothetical protein [Pseudomonadota bacterium]MBU2431285.1 hypothetical protein [Pseudomonadota bacterium]MBU2479661.1 hypothetical protein [Pseudomonadota bacterium]
MTLKFSSKEIHFLKTDSDDSSISPPETYFSDMLLDKPVQIQAFEKRLLKSATHTDRFLCAVIKISADLSDTLAEKAKGTVEATFASFLDHDRGIWESLSDTAFTLAFWDYTNEKKAFETLVSIKEKIQASLKADILMGVAQFPFHTFSKVDTFANALKAIDHAAFFGPDTLTRFDGVSLNISADRLYQNNLCELAIKEYQTGLEIRPNDINLINSLGVCYGVMGELDKALEQFKKAMEINPNEIMVIYNMGLLSKINMDTDKAIVYLRKAHGISSQVFEVELLLAHLLASRHKTDQALVHLKTAEQINPRSGLVFRMKGDIYLEKNQPEKAARAFNSAIKLHPSDAVSLSGYAKSLALQGKNLKIALTFAKNSVDLEPDNKTFKNRLNFIQTKIEETAPPEQTTKTA